MPAKTKQRCIQYIQNVQQEYVPVWEHISQKLVLTLQPDCSDKQQRLFQFESFTALGDTLRLSGNRAPPPHTQREKSHRE